MTGRGEETRLHRRVGGRRRWARKLGHLVSRREKGLLPCPDPDLCPFTRRTPKAALEATAPCHFLLSVGCSRGPGLAMFPVP